MGAGGIAVWPGCVMTADPAALVPCAAAGAVFVACGAG